MITVATAVVFRHRLRRDWTLNNSERFEDNVTHISLSSHAPSTFKASSSGISFPAEYPPPLHSGYLRAGKLSKLLVSSEAFNFGLIRSATDYYCVYTSAFAVPKLLDSTKFAPLRGLDFSFYRSRSKYHTKFDVMPYTEGGDKAVWAIMQPAWAAGIALANDDNGSPSEERAVYFELFNIIQILLLLTYLLTFNITSLVVGPILLILVAIFEYALARSRAAKRQQATYYVSPSTTVVNESNAQHEDIQVGESSLSSSSTVNTPSTTNSGMVGMGLCRHRLGNAHPGDPVFEEVLVYIPKWATATKLTDGLIEVEENLPQDAQVAALNLSPVPHGKTTVIVNAMKTLHRYVQAKKTMKLCKALFPSQDSFAITDEDLDPLKAVKESGMMNLHLHHSWDPPPPMDEQDLPTMGLSRHVQDLLPLMPRRRSGPSDMEGYWGTGIII
ncbi:hypothetical protein BT96DRAFT_1027499 [Gymnopus androsaceus JB14]|uniref:Uncharacterized protein n=1 Tax=Gymnopus androsaceus JB14 TaxID=1447944 RepID=A0A6A4GBP7_9AGAR|nr:hypothetical protein BT96DRAFT_1027499 [Gymnopus androsaceus JB14]